MGACNSEKEKTIIQHGKADQQTFGLVGFVANIDKRSNDFYSGHVGLGTHCSTPTVATDFNWIQIISMFHVP